MRLAAPRCSVDARARLPHCPPQAPLAHLVERRTFNPVGRVRVPHGAFPEAFLHAEQATLSPLGDERQRWPVGVSEVFEGDLDVAPAEVLERAHEIGARQPVAVARGTAEEAAHTAVEDVAMAVNVIAKALIVT